MKKIIFNNKKYIFHIRKQLNKIVAVFIVVSFSLNALNINQTFSYYNDTESSGSNSFSAGLLDFKLTNNTLNKIIGPEALGEISHASVVIPVDNSLPMQYDVATSIDTLTSNTDFCNGLTVESKLNGISKYFGPLPGLDNAVTTEFGSWEFRFDLPPDILIPNNVKCNAKIIFYAWRSDIPNKANSGWFDEEILDVSLTSRMVVLNEIYAKPNSTIAPKDREYIELYNNSSTPVDILGWQISEIAGLTEKMYPVVASGAVFGQVEPYNGASTIIPSGGYLVLQFGGTTSHLNDGGDTVKLYDNATTLLDSHTYSTIPDGKAIVRFPDGIGYWVDPEATPEKANMVSMEDLRLAGFDDSIINEILKLANLKNVTLLNDSTNEKKQESNTDIFEAITENIETIVGEIVPSEAEAPLVPLQEEAIIEEVKEEIQEEEIPVIETEEITTEVQNEELMTEDPISEEPVKEEIIEEITPEVVTKEQIIEEATENVIVEEQIINEVEPLEAKSSDVMIEEPVVVVEPIINE